MFEAILSQSKVNLCGFKYRAGTGMASAVVCFDLCSWHDVTAQRSFFGCGTGQSSGQYGLQLNLMAILFLLNLLLLVIFSFHRLQKPVVVALFAIGAFSYYFIDSFGIVVDKAMLQNAVETDAG